MSSGTWKDVLRAGVLALLGLFGVLLGLTLHHQTISRDACVQAVKLSGYKAALEAHLIESVQRGEFEHVHALLRQIRGLQEEWRRLAEQCFNGGLP